MMSDFKSKLDKAAQIHTDMVLLINICKSNTSNLDLWGIYWESFWELSMGFPFKVEWYDPNLCYQEDIMSRYMAVEGFMEGINNVVKGNDCE